MQDLTLSAPGQTPRLWLNCLENNPNKTPLPCSPEECECLPSLSSQESEVLVSVISFNPLISQRI